MYMALKSENTRDFGFSVASVDMKRVKVLLVDNLISGKINFKIKLSTRRTFTLNRKYYVNITLNL